MTFMAGAWQQVVWCTAVKVESSHLKIELSDKERLAVSL